jgi:hypothetical protein
LTTGLFPHDNFSSVYRIFTKLGHIIPLWKGKNPMYFGVIRSKVKVTVTINRILTTWSFPHNNFSSVYWIFTKLGHMIPLWKGKNPIYVGVITIIPFDNLYRRAYFVMHTFLVFIIKSICLKHNIVYFIVEKSISDRRSNIMLYILKS